MIPTDNPDTVSQPMEAIVLAGGLGTRLRSVVSDLPKSMAPVNGRPFLEYLLDYLILQEVNHVVLSVGYMREIIMDHFGSSYKGIPVDYAIEEEPMGTGGGIRLALWQISGNRAFALNGDSLFRVDLRTMMTFHTEQTANITMALREVPDTERYGRVSITPEGRITGFDEKGRSGPGYINGGVYLIEKLYLMEPEFRGRFSIEKECFEPNHATARFFGFPSAAYFLDIGLPETLKQAQHDFPTFFG